MSNKIAEMITELLYKTKTRFSHEYGFFRIWGNFNGYSIVRINVDDPFNPVEIDGKIHSLEYFEDWLYSIK